MSGARQRNTKKLTLQIQSADVSNSVTPPSTSRIRDTVVSFGFEVEDVNTAITKLQESGQSICYQTVLDTSMKIQRERITMSLRGGQSGISVLPPGEPGVSYQKQDPETPPEIREKRLERRRKRLLEEKKVELVAAIEHLTYRCKMCNDAEATILLLPCAHLVCCENCLMDVRRCPLPQCNKIVRGTKEVFFA